MKKGTYGYIKNKKIRLIIYLLLTVVIALTIYFIGYFASGKSKENIATIFAVLWVLPGAKIIVTLALVMPYKGLTKAEYERVQQVASKINIVYDLVLTSPEKVMRIKALVVMEDKYIVLPCAKQDKEHICTYVGKHMSNYSYEKDVEICDTVEDFIAKLQESIIVTDDVEKLISKLMILAV